MSGKDYAISNLETIANNNIDAYASYARSEINDTYGELYDKVKAAEEAVCELIEFIRSH